MREEDKERNWPTIGTVSVILVILLIITLFIGDENLFRIINLEYNTPTLDLFFSIIARFGAVILLGASMFFFINKRGEGSKTALILLIIGFWTSIWLGYTLKGVFSRPRPFEALSFTRLTLSTTPESASFPSGEAIIAFFVWSIDAVKSKKLAIPTLIFACLIAYSRVYVGVHYPLDVISGALIGILIGTILLGIEDIIKRTSAKNIRTWSNNMR